MPLQIGPLHTRDGELMTITLQALSLVEKAEPVQVHSTLRLRDQRSMWMQDGCKVYMDSWHDIEQIMFHGHLDYFQKPPHRGRPNTKLGDHGTPYDHNRQFILFYHVWGPAWMEIHEIAFVGGPSHMWVHTTLEDLWPHYMILDGCLERPLDTFSF